MMVLKTHETIVWWGIRLLWRRAECGGWLWGQGWEQGEPVRRPQSVKTHISRTGKWRNQDLKKSEIERHLQKGFA